MSDTFDLKDYLPYPIIKIENNYDSVMNEYYKLREEGLKSDFTPIIMLVDGNGALTDLLTDDFKNPQEFTKETLGDFDSKTKLKRYHEENEETMREILEVTGPFNRDDVHPIEQNALTFELSSLYFNYVYIIKIPTKNPAEVFAYFPFGGWNDCPTNDIHIYYAQKWFDQYGAIPVVITSDTIEYSVSRPVQVDDPNLENLIKEMCMYCADFAQFDSFSEGCSMICNAGIWSFWWD